jgi:drug/metabolite transporter (DMT)-like permease
MIHAQSSLRGIILTISSCAAFSLMCIMIKFIPGIDSYKISLFRFIIGMGVLGTAALFGKIHLHFVSGKMLFVRGFCGGIAVYLFYLSIAKLGMAKGTVLSYSYPLFATILSGIFFKEKIGVWTVLSIIAAIIGIFLTATDDSHGLAFSSFGLYEILAILGAIATAVAVVSIKQLHGTDSTYAISFSQCTMGMWVVIIPSNVVPCSIGYTSGLILILIGMVAISGQLLMTEGYRYTTVTTGSLLGLFTPVFNLLVGALVFHESLSARAIAGSLIILGSCAGVIYFQERTS